MSFHESGFENPAKMPGHEFGFENIAVMSAYVMNLVLRMLP